MNGQLKCMVENCGSQIVWSIWNVTSGNGIKDPGDQVEPCGRNKVSRLNVSAYAASSDTMVIQCSESKSKRNGGRLYSKFFVQIPLQTAKGMAHNYNYYNTLIKFVLSPDLQTNQSSCLRAVITAITTLNYCIDLSKITEISSHI